MRRLVLRFLILGVLLAATPTWVAAQQKAQPPKPAPKAAAADTAIVNLNTATVEQLDGLPGIGAKMAARIVEYRQKNGPFKKIEDLMNVQGIGEKNFLKLKPRLTVTAAKPAGPDGR